MANEQLVVGIDFSKKWADLALLKSNGELIKRHQRVDNTAVGFEQAKTLILQTLQEQGLTGLEVAGEATSYYWLPMFIEMEQDAELASYNPDLFLLNPKWVHWYKKMQPTNHKNDKIDPAYIGNYLRQHRPPIVWHFDEHWLSLRLLTRLRFHLVKSLTREKNLFSLYLFLAYTTYAARKPFSNPSAVISRVLLRDPVLLASLEDLQDDEIADLLREQGYRSQSDPKQSAQRLRQVLQERYQLPETMAASVQLGIGLLIETIQNFEGQIAQVEGWIKEHVKVGYPEVAWLDSIPGIGLVFASGLAAEIGDIQRFLNVQVWDDRKQQMRPRHPHEVADAVGKYAGLWWPENSSGDFQAENKHLSREGNAYLRYYILEAADSLRQHLPDFTRYYNAKYNQALQHKHKRAIVLTGRKALDLFVALLRHNETYRAKEASSPTHKG
jgi:transposase